jgi:predicted small secreted protein
MTARWAVSAPSARAGAKQPHFNRTPGGPDAIELDCQVISFLVRLPAFAGLLLLAATSLAACATTGSGAGAAICHAADGTLVPLNDQRCPQSVRDALNPATPPPMSIPQSIANQQYDAYYGLSPGDWGFRPYD